MSGQTIKCHVSSCKFNEGKQYCTLNDIMVGSSCQGSSCHSKKETECDSFESASM